MEVMVDRSYVSIHTKNFVVVEGILFGRVYFRRVECRGKLGRLRMLRLDRFHELYTDQ